MRIRKINDQTIDNSDDIYAQEVTKEQFEDFIDVSPLRDDTKRMGDNLYEVYSQGGELKAFSTVICDAEHHFPPCRGLYAIVQNPLTNTIRKGYAGLMPMNSQDEA